MLGLLLPSRQQALEKRLYLSNHDFAEDRFEVHLLLEDDQSIGLKWQPVYTIGLEWEQRDMQHSDAQPQKGREPRIASTPSSATFWRSFDGVVAVARAVTLYTLCAPRQARFRMIRYALCLQRASAPSLRLNAMHSCSPT